MSEPNTDTAGADGPRKPREETSSSFAAQEITAFYSGVMFLTRLSVPKWVNHSMYWLSLSTAYFPIIGAMVGFFGALNYSWAYYFFPASPVIPAIIYTAATIRFTGGFHEDGLADMCDGFGGGWTRTSILRIMRDSTIGAFAGMGLVLYLTLKVHAIANLLVSTIQLSALPAQVASTAPFMWLLTHFPVAFVVHAYRVARIGGVLVAAHCIGRWACTYLLYRYKYVENASAAGKEFLLTVTTTRFVFASVTTVAIARACLFALPLRDFVVVMVVAAVTTVRLGDYINRVIGGVIGDCCGATEQLVELSVYLVLGVDWLRVFDDAGAAYAVLKTVVDSFIQ